MRERLTAADSRFLLICVLLFGATIWYAATHFYIAFPEASIDFVVTRPQALATAQQFLASQGYPTTGYREASRFDFDDSAKTFLERELGLEKANQLMGSHIRLWRWSYRWFRPLQKEEFQAEVTTRGELVSFRHELAEKTAGANLTSDQARAIAEAFLTNGLHRDPAALEFVEASSQTRPARTDHTFTWKERDFQIKDATYRFEVTVLGDRIGAFNEYLKVPEAWTRDYQHMRSRNDTASTFDAVLMILLALGGLVVLMIRVRNRDVKWGRAVIFGAITFVLSFLASLNAFPLQEFGYPTTDSYGSFLANRLLQMLLSAAASGVFIFLLTAWAEPVYRQACGRFLSIGSLLRWRGLRTKSFFRGAVLGLALAGIFAAYQIVFYTTAYRFGAWSPADVPYSDMLNTSFPWLFVLFGGFFPAVFEEFMFRMFSIPFLTALLRRPWLGVVLSAFIWGFGHVAYPQQPFFIRGVEVGIGGVALGIIMLRYGVLPTLIWHYSVDAMYTALLLLRSHNPYYVLSGAASGGIMLIPAFAAGIAYLYYKGFEPEAGLTNADEGTSRPDPVAAAALPPPITLPYEAWPVRRVTAAVIIAAVMLSLVLLIPAHRIESTDFKLDVPQARAAADTFVRSRGFNPSAFHNVVYPDSAFNWFTAKYFLERRPISYLEKMAADYQPLGQWTVRYYKPLDKEEIRVSLDPSSGRVIEFQHELPEDGPGADIPPEAARDIATRYIASRGMDLAKLELKETTSEKRKARRDHSMRWEAKPGDPRNLDEAHYRVVVDVAGDQVAHFATFWKLPEDYQRERQRTVPLQIVLTAIQVMVIACAVVLAVWIIVRKTRQSKLRWKPALLIGAACTGIGTLSLICSYPLMFRSFNTAWSMEMFQAFMLVGLLIGVIGIFILSAFEGGLLLSLRPDCLTAFTAVNRRRLGRDALLATLLGAAAFLFASHFRALLTAQFHAYALPELNPPQVFAALVPAINEISSGVSSLLQWSVTIALIGLAAFAYLQRPWLIGLASLLAVAGFCEGHTAGEFLLQYASMTGAFILYGAILLYFFRRNYLAYALWLWTVLLGKAAYTLASQPSLPLRIQGWMTAGFLLITIVWAIWPVFSAARPIEARTAGQP
jgi:membrane protease YdiL (CAAX protease family)